MSLCVPQSTLDNTDVERIQWFYLIFRECVYSGQEAFSVLLGYLSIGFWLSAQLPQVIENHKLGSASSLSIEFLAIWFAGDLTNFLGCVLTHQLPFQRYLSTYFVFIDICLVCQWIYYNNNCLAKSTTNDSNRPRTVRRRNNPRYHHRDAQATDPLLPRQKKRTKHVVLSAVMLFGTLHGRPSSLQKQITSAAATTKADYLPTPSTLIAGRVFAWACASLYLTSRIPQILKNYQRKSTDGLSPFLFICAAGGNLTYASSILPNPRLPPGALAEAVPYLIGSIGTLLFDFTIFCQFAWYSRRNSIISGATIATKLTGEQNQLDV